MATASLTLVGHFRAMAHNNTWSNHRLYAACALLSDADLAAPRTSFFPSIVLTLHHILEVDRGYLDALEGDKPQAQPTPAIGADLAALRAAQMGSDRRLLAFCGALMPDDLGRETRLLRDDGVKIDSVAAVLAHLFVHQIHHRGQVHGMLSGTTVPPPQLDEFFLAEDAALRRPDLIALGLAPD